MEASLKQRKLTKKPSPIGNMTPNKVMIIEETPQDLIWLVSVSRPASNIIKTTPILLKNSNPSITVGLNTNWFGINFNKNWKFDFSTNNLKKLTNQ